MNPILSWTLRIIPAFILAYTLPSKFSGSADSKEIFTLLTERSLGNDSLESLARVGTGLLELVCVILLLIPRFAQKGAILTIFAMSSALFCHTFFIGFIGYHGTLAFFAFIAFVCCAVFLIKTYLSQDPRIPR